MGHPRSWLQLGQILVNVNRRRILLVDDEENVRLSLCLLLEEAGFEVVEAASLKDARTALQSGTFDAAVLDRAVGRDNGLDLVPDVKKSSPHATIIVLSGTGSGEHIPSADLVIAKLESPASVLAKMEAVIRS